jgi:hypothetical protein
MISIDMLADDVLLEIFDFYVGGAERIQAWQSLVHVCRRWRSVVLGSPNRLNLRLVCTTRTPARDTLDVWPPLPLLIQGRVRKGLDVIISVLERRDRVHVIKPTHVSSLRLKKLSAAISRRQFLASRPVRVRGWAAVVYVRTLAEGRFPPAA